MLEQKPNVRQVLRAYTATDTYTSFQEHRLGTLEVGKLADLVVLDANPFAVEPENLAGISVLRTVVDGGQRFGDDDPC